MPLGSLRGGRLRIGGRCCSVHSLRRRGRMQLVSSARWCRRLVRVLVSKTWSTQALRSRGSRVCVVVGRSPKGRRALICRRAWSFAERRRSLLVPLRCDRWSRVRKWPVVVWAPCGTPLCFIWWRCWRIRCSRGASDYSTRLIVRHDI